MPLSLLREYPFQCFAASPNGEIVVGYSNKLLVFTDVLNPGKSITTPPLSSGRYPTDQVAFPNEGRRVAAGIEGGYKEPKQVVIWDITDSGLSEVMRISLPGQSNKGVGFSPDGKQIAVGAGETFGGAIGLVKGNQGAALFEIPNTEIAKSVDGQAQKIVFIEKLRWLEDGTIVLVDAQGRALKIDPQTNQVIAQTQFKGSLKKAGISPVGMNVAAHLSNASPGQPPPPDARAWVTVYVDGTERINRDVELRTTADSLEYSLDGKWFALCTREFFELYRVADGEVLAHMDWGNGGIWNGQASAAMFLKDGTLLLSTDKTRAYRLDV